MSIKFVGNLPEPLDIGHIVVIFGRLRHNADRFDLNLISGRTINEDIPLHLSWRHDENMIVRNTKDHRGWGSEDRIQHRKPECHDLGINRGEDFEFRFIVQQNWFDVEINGRPYCQYHHRMSISAVRTILIERDVEYISGVSQFHVTCDIVSSLRYLVGRNMAFIQEITNSLNPGTVIAITAIPTGDSNGQFTISFRHRVHDQHAFQISTRFDEKNIVLNSTDTHGKWLDEERHGHFPFVLNQPFRIAIGFGFNTFHIAINGHRFPDYEFRTPDVYNTVGAFTISEENGLHMIITGFDHVRDDSSNMAKLTQLSKLGNSLQRNF